MLGVALQKLLLRPKNIECGRREEEDVTLATRSRRRRAAPLPNASRRSRGPALVACMYMIAERTPFANSMKSLPVFPRWCVRAAWLFFILRYIAMQGIPCLVL